MNNTSDLNLIDRVGANTIIDTDLEVVISNCTANETRGIYIGSDCRIYSRNRMVLGDMQENPDANMMIKNNVMINAGCYLSGEGGLEIEDYVLIGPNTCILSAGHNYSDPSTPIQKQGFSYGKIVIKKDAWIGASCVLLQGITIGTGAVVGAGSVVTGDIPPMAVAVGNPAKIIRLRSLSDTHTSDKVEAIGLHDSYQTKNDELQMELNKIKSSLAWRLIIFYRSIIEFILPENSRRRRLYQLIKLGPAVFSKKQ